MYTKFLCHGGDSVGERSKRMSARTIVGRRQRWLATAAVGALAATMMTACSPAPAPGIAPAAAVPAGPAKPPAASGAPRQTAAQPKRGGYLRLLLPYSAQNIDPYFTE